MTLNRTAFAQGCVLVRTAAPIVVINLNPANALFGA